MIANGPTGIGPPNSSAMPVITHGISSPRAAHATAYVECVCTTPPTSGMCRYTYAWAAVSLDGDRSLPGVPGTTLPVEVAQDHGLRGELVVGDPGRLDDEQVGARHPARDVAGGPDDEAVPDQLGVQPGDVLARRGDGSLDLAG